MIRFKLNEIIELIPAFHGALARRKRQSPPGRWIEWPKMSVHVTQEEDSDRWIGFIGWELMGGSDRFPCRDAGKNELISRMDPPDSLLTELAANRLANKCTAVFRDQYKEWIQGDFYSEDIL